MHNVIILTVQIMVLFMMKKMVLFMMQKMVIFIMQNMVLFTVQKILILCYGMNNIIVECWWYRQIRIHMIAMELITKVLMPHYYYYK